MRHFKLENENFEFQVVVSDNVDKVNITVQQLAKCGFNEIAQTCFIPNFFEYEDKTRGLNLVGFKNKVPLTSALLEKINSFNGSKIDMVRPLQCHCPKKSCSKFGLLPPVKSKNITQIQKEMYCYNPEAENLVRTSEPVWLCRECYEGTSKPP